MFPVKKTQSDGDSTTPSPLSAEPRSKSLTARPKSNSPAQASTSGNSGAQAGNLSQGNKLRRSLSLFKPKNRAQASAAGTSGSFLDDNRNQIWFKENESLKKSMNKLHKNLAHDWNKTVRRLNAKKIKHQKKVEKEVEDQMNREKASMQAKNSDLNAATLSRSSALTPETANKIVNAREARVNKEVGRTANKRKIQEFEKLEDYFKEQVEESKLKHYHRTVKAQIHCMDKITKKYQKRFRDAELKYFAHGSPT